MAQINYNEFVTSQIPQGTMISLQGKRSSKLYKFVGIVSEEKMEEVEFTDGTKSQMLTSSNVIVLRGEKGLVAMEESDFKGVTIGILR